MVPIQPPNPIVARHLEELQDRIDQADLAAQDPREMIVLNDGPELQEELDDRGNLGDEAVPDIELHGVPNIELRGVNNINLRGVHNIELPRREEVVHDPAVEVEVEEEDDDDGDEGPEGKNIYIYIIIYIYIYI